MAAPVSPSETDLSAVSKDLEVPFDPFFIPIDDPEGSDLSIDLSEDASYEIEMEEYYDQIMKIKKERAAKKALEDAEDELVYDDPKKKKKKEEEEDTAAADTKDKGTTKGLFSRRSPPPEDEGDEGRHLVFLDESIPKRVERGSAKPQIVGSSEVAQRAVRWSVLEEPGEPEDLVEEKVGAPPKRPKSEFLDFKLTKEELNEPHQRGLIPRDADEDANRALWNFKTSEWVPIPLTCGELELFTLEGNTFYIPPESVVLSDDDIAEYDSDGHLLPPLPVVRIARPEDEDTDSEEEPEKQVDETENAEEEEEELEDELEGEDRKAEAKEEEPLEDEKKKKKKKPKKLLSNMFNYADREVLTVNAVTRSEFAQTVPPPAAKISHNVTQWGIYDAYQSDYAATVAAKEKERREKQVIQRTEAADPNEKSVVLTNEESYAYRFYNAVKLMERLVTQNTFEDIAFDAQFYDDPADKYRQPEGTLLPLWEFEYEETIGTCVTDIKWSPRYYDLFAASFGTYNVHAFKTQGMVCVYTLKNPSFPEYKFKFKTGCQTVDIHDKEPYYLAVGLYNGFVAIINIKIEGKPFRLESDIMRKHVGVVWEVQWCNDHRDRQLGFYSAGSDGRIYKWLVYTHELSMTPIIRLDINAEVGFARIPYYRAAYATCISFKPDDPEIFLVGTAEGMIFKCNISYSSSYLYVYRAHDLSVYRIAYNPYFPKVFASASCDWKMKIWEDCKADPLFIFDLYCAVMDVQWSPYSSTVLAATTSDGRLNLYDLNVNQVNPICVQIICYPQSGYTTRLRFNLKLPFILVGDSKGFLVIMKVSPNCRIPSQLGKKKVRGKDKAKDDPKKLELMKFKKVFQYVREKDVLEHVPDVDLRTNEEKQRLVERWMQAF